MEEPAERNTTGTTSNKHQQTNQDNVEAQHAKHSGGDKEMGKASDSDKGQGQEQQTSAKTQKAKRVQNPYNTRSKTLEIVQAQEEKTEEVGNNTNSNQEKKGDEAASNKEGTPKASGAGPTWLAVAATNTVLRTHEKVKYKYSMNAEMGFTVERDCKELPPAVTQAIIWEVLINIFKRGKEVDHKFAINPYFEGTNLPTIKKVEDIPFAPNEIKSYLPHTYQRTAKVRQGQNTGYLANLTFTIPPEEFVHHWELSKREFKKVPYVQIKMTPMQDSETFNTVGFLVNSSEKQCVTQIQEQLSKDLGMKIGIVFWQAAVDRGTLDGCWKGAKAKAGRNTRDLFRNAPLAMQIYADSKENTLAAATNLYPKYRRQIDGQYPRFPDGTRMKFVPATHFLDMKSRKTAKELLQQQVRFQSNTVEAPIPVRDPYQCFEGHGNRSMMELLLDLQCQKRDNEPYFRHIAKKWTKDYEDRRYEVSIHTNMYSEAASVLRNLEEVLTKEYGPKVAAALGKPETTDDDDFLSTTSASLITLSYYRIQILACS